MEVRRSIIEIRKEAERRADEDGYGRVVYLAEGGRLRICMWDDFSDPVMDLVLGIFIVRPGKQVEIL